MRFCEGKRFPIALLRRLALLRLGVIPDEPKQAIRNLSF